MNGRCPPNEESPLLKHLQKRLPSPTEYIQQLSGLPYLPAGLPPLCASVPPQTGLSCTPLDADYCVRITGNSYWIALPRTVFFQNADVIFETH